MVNSTRATTSLAVEDKNHSENVSRVLYPDDSTYSGRELRLRQEYFLVSATVQDILSRHYMLHKTFDNLADKIAIHLNDTHPVLSIPELMRLLIDEHKFSWDEAFEVTCQVFSYTNHTLMSEALETWPVDMLGKILPRHLQIIFEINDYFLKTLQEQYPNRYRAAQPKPRLSTSPTAVACGWPGWRWWSATRSTACRSCIRG